MIFVVHRALVVMVQKEDPPSLVLGLFHKQCKCFGFVPVMGFVSIRSRASKTILKILSLRHGTARSVMLGTARSVMLKPSIDGRAARL